MLETPSHCARVFAVRTIEYHIARKFRGVKFLRFFGFGPARNNFNPQNYIYVIDNGNWTGIRENKIVKT